MEVFANNIGKVSANVLREKLAVAENQVPTGLYRHYKGNRYEVTGYGINESTMEVDIEYMSIDTGIRFHRSLKSWLAPVDNGLRFTPADITAKVPQWKGTFE